MAHALQSQQADESTHAPPVAGHDDDRGAAQRASLAGLRREAAQLPGAQAEAQHSKADATSFQALQSSMQLVTAKLVASRRDIEQMIAQPMTEAARDPARQTITSIVEDRVGEIIMLDMHMGLRSSEDGPSYGLTSHAHLLTPELGGLETAATMFAGAVKHAQTVVERLVVNLAPIDQRLGNLRDKIGMKRGEPITSRLVEQRPEQVVRSEAIEDNLRAVLDAARAVRAGAASKEHRTASGDLQMMLRHLAELDALVGELGRAAQHKLAPRLRHALAEVESVGAAVKSVPELDQAYHHSATLPGHLRSLRAKAS